MKALIFGHSHMWAIRRALVDVPPSRDLRLVLCGTMQFPGSLIYENYRSRSVLLNSALLSALNTNGAEPDHDILVSGVQGNQYNALALLTDAFPFDFCHPGLSLPITDGTPLIPFEAIREMLREELREFGLFFQSLSRLSYRAMIHLSPPPPIADNAFIGEKLPKQPGADEPEVSSPALRLKLWMTQVILMKQTVEENGGIFLEAPPAARDDAGFLKEVYWKDAVHANSGYGALQLAQIEDLMGKMEDSA